MLRLNGGFADLFRLAEEGAKLVLTDINRDDGEALADEIGEAALFIEQDVSEEQSWDLVIDQTLNRFGRLDALVNNAGINSYFRY